jgi:hypothetical protein
MLLTHSSSVVENSSFTFLINSASLSEGITSESVRTLIIINGSFHTIFANSKGGSGGAMAFYDES